MVQLGNIRGATLVESLASLLLGSVMIAGLYGFYRSELFHHLTQEAKTTTLEDARGALDIIVQDLRNAGSWGAGSAPAERGGEDDPSNDPDAVCNRVYAASASMIHVQMDLNGNGSCADAVPRESIRYELTGPTSTCPGPSIIRRNGDCLIAGVAPLMDGKLFRYYDNAGAELGDTPPPQAIKRVRMAFAVQLKNPDPARGGNVSSALSTSVEFRN
jgi:Tfp pilus assembly protein PilW